MTTATIDQGPAPSSSIIETDRGSGRRAACSPAALSVAVAGRLVLDQLSDDPTQRILVGFVEPVGEQACDEVEVRLGSRHQGLLSALGEGDLDAAPVVVGGGARDQSRLAH